MQLKIQCSGQNIGRNKNGERCGNRKILNEDEVFFCHLHKNQNKGKIDNELSNEKIEEVEQTGCKEINSLTRFLHFIIDSVVWLIIAFILLRIFTPQINAIWSRMNRHDVIGYVIMFAITFAIPFFTFIGYYFIMEVSFQKTVAKFITRTKVVANDEKKPKIIAILKRTFYRLIPFVDQVTFLYNQNGFHDKRSGTKVIKLHKNKDKEIVKSSTRLIHFIIDSIVWLIIAFTLSRYLPIKLLMNVNYENYIANYVYYRVIHYVILFVTFFGYYYIMEVSCQKTVAKFITKTKVVINGGNKPKKSAILIRTFCRLIPFEIFSFLFPKKGCFHDRLSNTMVVFGANTPVWIRMKEILLQQVKKIDNLLFSTEKRFKKFSLYVTIAFGILSIIYVSPEIDNRIKTENVESDASKFFIGYKFLESQNESTRIRGANNLYNLANKSLDYQEDVCDVLCEQFRKITSNPAYQKMYKEKPSVEIQNIIDLLFKSYWINNILDQYDKNLTGTYLSGANFYRRKVKNVDFSNAELREVDFADAELNNVNFTNAEFQNVNFKSRGGYQYSDMHSNNYQNTRLSDIYFLEARLYNVDFSDAILNAVDFESAKLINVNLRNYMSNSSPSDYKRFSDVNFSGTILEGYGYNKITENRFTLELTRENIQETKE